MSNQEINMSNKRSFTKMNGEDDDSSKRQKIETVLEEKAKELNNIYLHLLENIKNNKKYSEFENMYRNEEMDIVQLLTEQSLVEEDMNMFNLNHTFQVLPLDGVKMEDLSDVEDIDSDSDFDPLEDARKMVEKVFGIVEEEETTDCEYLIKNSKLSDEEKAKLTAEYTLVKQIRDNQLPDKLKVLQSNLPINVKVEILEKMEILDNAPHDDIKVRDWIRQVMQIPFGKYSKNPVEDPTDSVKVTEFLTSFHDTLDKAIYGQDKVKESLLEIITKWTTSGSIKGNCLAIAGPPGVGKTSIVREGLAKALKRPFCSFSLAGVSDENYLTGFPQTYEGSTCGRFAKMLMDTGCMNPIIFMDELDKVDTQKSMSVFNKLIEVTDFSQNHEIEDHYFGSNIKLDMSQCIFIFSLNEIRLVSPILRDRLEVITVQGFQREDKIKIAKNFLVPQMLSEYKEQYNFTEDLIKHIIMRVSTEQGVRNLKRALDKIIRKLNVLQYYNNKKLSYKMKKFNKETLVLTNRLVDKLLKDDRKVDPMIMKLYI